MLCVDVGDKIKQARDYHSPALSQKELAAKLGVDTSRVGHWESKHTVPRARVAALCEVLSITEDWLFDPKDERLPTDLRQRPIRELPQGSGSQAEQRLMVGGYVAIPVWRGISAGSTEEAYFEDVDFVEYKEVSPFLVTANAEHVLCVADGESMSPRIHDRERAILRLDPDVPTGHLVVARAPDGKSYIKRYVRVNGRRELHPVNLEGGFKPIQDLRNWELRGGIIAILKDVAPGEPNMEWAEGRYLQA